jgi:DNA-binding MarR family transcriptional regulator
MQHRSEGGRGGRSTAADETLAIWIGLARIRRRLVRLIERRLKRVGLPPLLWHDALLLLASQPSCEASAPDLEQGLSLRQYQVSRLIHGMADAGLVVRRRLPVIGRTNRVRLTGRGRELLDRMAEVHAAAIEREVGAQFTADEATALVGLLDRFCRAAPVPEPEEGPAQPRRSSPQRTAFAALAQLAE